MIRARNDCGSERDGREEGYGAPIVGGGNATSVFETAEHGRDAVTALVAALAVFDGIETGFSPGNARFDPFLLKGIPKPVGVVAAIPQ